MRPPSPSSSSVLIIVALAWGCGGAPPPGPSSPPSAPPATACSAASFDELSRQLRDYFCNTAEGSIASSELDSCDDIEVTMLEPMGAGGSLDARVLRLATPTGPMHPTTGVVYSLLVCAGGQPPEAFLLEDLWSVTDEEATTVAEGTVSGLALVDLVPGGTNEVRLDVAFSQSRTLWHGCILESSRHEHTIVCDNDGSGPRCVDVPTLTRRHAECDDMCLVRQLAEDDRDCEDEGAPSIDEELRLTLELGAGRARITASEPGDFPGAVLVGDHTIDELLGLRPMEPLVVFPADDAPGE